MKNNKFYLVVDDEFIGPIIMDHTTCLNFATCLSPNKLTKDIEEWRDKSEAGTSFQLTNTNYLVCLNLDALLKQ